MWNTVTDKLKRKIEDLPENSGVYIMRDASGNIIYIGKAVVLKNRVRQYFNAGEKQVKVQAMIDNVADFDYIITLTEKDALALEANLIRKHKPRYNILLKDDKRSPFIKIDLSRTYPTAEITRVFKRDGAKYFGPYFNGISVRDIAEILRSAYKLRGCGKTLTRKKRACLNHHIGLCDAPCMGLVSEEEYRKNVAGAMSFLSGNTAEATAILTRKMNSAAENEDYELAIKYRDKLEMVARLKERTVANLGGVVDVDAFSIVRGSGRAVVSVCIVRGGKMMGVKNFSVIDNGEEDGELLTNFCTQYYGLNLPAPQELCFPSATLDGDALGEYLALFSAQTPEISFPRRGTKKRLVDTARQNAEDYFVKNKQKEEREYELTVGATERLADILGIKSAHRIECYDISHISGTDKVASQSVFIGGAAAKREYRKYAIKTVEGSDDFACMKEVLSRRLSRALAGDERFDVLPDLIVIDGGKGQLSYAQAAMKELGFNLPMVALAEKEEEIYTPFSPLPIVLERRDNALKLLQRVRDEAHRFAVTYHRKKRSKRQLSELEQIKGVGEKKRAILLRSFGSAEEISNAGLEAIASVSGIDRRTAQSVYDYFQGKKNDKS